MDLKCVLFCVGAKIKVSRWSPTSRRGSLRALPLAEISNYDSLYLRLFCCRGDPFSSRVSISASFPAEGKHTNSFSPAMA